jgi:SulP family sulfate permease
MDQNKLRTQLHSTWAYLLRPIDIFKSYPRQYLRPDLLAGLTIAVILLPQAMAYALIAELPTQMGLYSAIFGAIVGALWGSSNHLQTGPTNAASLLVLSILLGVAVPDTAAYLIAAGMLTLLVGLLRLGMGFARLGLLVNFVSDSVITGFTAGAGILIFVNQLRHLLRLSVPSTPGLWETLTNLGTSLPQTHLPSLILGVGVIVIIMLLKQLNPKLPGPLIAITLAALITSTIGLTQRGVLVIGEIPRGLPPLVRLPILDLGLITQLTSGALAIAAIGLIEAMSIARSIAAQTGQHLDSNQEFVGQGIANIVCAFTSGYTCSGSFTRSAVNYQVGAQTPISSVFSGIFVLLGIFAFGWLLAAIPLPALAGVVLVISIGLINIKEMKNIWLGPRGDRFIMLVTLSATLLLPLQFAVLSGILFSLAHYILKTSVPQVNVVVPDEDFVHLTPQPNRPSCPQLGIIEILGDLYFGSSHHVEESILENLERNPGQRFLLLHMTNVNHIDISGIHMLEHILRNYREMGGDLFIARYQKDILDILYTTGFCDRLGEGNLLKREQDAIGRLFYRYLDPATCIYECPHRVFKECQNLPKRHDLVGEPHHTQPLRGKVAYITPVGLWGALHSEPVPVLIDVREASEFRRGRIIQARNIPFIDLLENPEGLPQDHPVVLVCRTGWRSARAANTLSNRGFQNLRVLQGGMLAWESANLLEAIE